MRVAFFVFLMTAGFLQTAGADEIVNKGASGRLSDAASWGDGSKVPTASDTAVWDGANGTAAGWSHEMGADLAFYGMRLTNGTEALSLFGTNTLTLGAGGMSNSLANFFLAVPLRLSADQNWLVEGNLHVSNTVAGAGVTIIGGRTGGNFVFYAPVSLSSLALQNVKTILCGDASLAACPSLSLATYFSLTPDFSTDVYWSDRMPFAWKTGWNGILSFGNTIQGLFIGKSMTLTNGNLLVSTASPDRKSGRIDLYGSKLVNAGGGVTNNWLYIWSGEVAQSAGSLTERYDIYAGLQAPGFFTLKGGDVLCRRVNVGVANASITNSCLALEGGFLDVNEGITLGVTYDNMLASTEWGTLTNRSASTAASLKVSGGRLTAMSGIFLGNAPTLMFGGVWDGYAEIELRGGEIRSPYFSAGNMWQKTANGVTTWCNFFLSGATLFNLYGATNNLTVQLRGENSVIQPDLPTATFYQMQPLTGPGGFRKTGAGKLTLATKNTYKGTTRIEAGTLLVATSATPPDIPADDALPVTKYVWKGDSVTNGPGDPIVDWYSTNGVNTFSYSLVKQFIQADAQKPTVSTNLLCGHKTIAFDKDRKTALCLTKWNALPLAGATNMTFAFVLRTTTPGKAKIQDDMYNTACFFSAAGTPFLFGITEDARLRYRWGLCSAQRRLDDGEPHVVLFTWVKDSKTASLSVDGYLQTQTADIYGNAITDDSRVLLGGIDGGSNAYNFFSGDLAEFRCYPNAALSGSQQRTLGRELCETYGAEPLGFMTAEEKSIASLASTNIVVASGAVLDCGAGGMTLTNEQTVCGAGTVANALTLAAGATLAATSTVGNLSFTGTLTLNNGSTVRWPFLKAGVSAPVRVKNLALGQGTITVDIPTDIRESSPSGVLLSYSGELVDNGVRWAISGGHKYSKVEVDTAAKVIRIKTARGLVIKLL